MDVSAILKRAKDRLGVSTDFELARILGVSKSTLSNWKSRNSIDYDILFTKCKLADFDWLIRGKERDPSRLITVYDRILEVLSREGVNIREFEKNIGTIPTIMSGAIHNNEDKDVQRQWAEIVCERYKNYSLNWILTGEGDMYNTGNMAIDNSGIIIHGDNQMNNSSIDNRHFYSDSPDVLRAQIELLDERIKEKDAQIKEKDAQIKEKDAQIKQLLDILQKK